MELAPGAADPAAIPDLTLGYGTRAYDAFQTAAARLETAFLDNVNLAGVLARLGVDPETAINTALGNALVSALTGVAVPVDGVPVLGPILDRAGIDNAAALLALLGFDLADPLNLSGAATPGINLITAGPPFSLLKFLGVDLGWVPAFPNAVADEINGTPYLGISPLAVLQAIPTGNLNIVERGTLEGLIGTVDGLIGDAEVVDVRVPVVIGFGLGAFAAGMAYPQVVADLANQPGGENNVGADPLAGSVTILPMILLRNPGRANGGLFARAYPLAGLFGIDTVTPDTEVTSSSDGTGLSIPVGDTGIVIGDANLIPIKIDGTVEYDPLSDVPAWPNPVSLANSVAAAAFPTYILRGVTAASLTEVVTDQLTPQLAEALADDGPLALNLYLTVPVNDALPLLEPARLPVDVVNLFTGANLNNPFATAVEPALTTLVNLGYTDVERTVVDGVPVYDRTLDQANVITPFGTLPSGVDWGQVPEDLVRQLQAGIEEAIEQGLISDTPVNNPLATLASLLGVNLPGTAATPSPLTGTTVSDLTDEATAAAAGAVPSEQAPASGPNAEARRAGSAPEIVLADTPASDSAVRNTAGTDAAAEKANARTEASAKRAAARLDKIAKEGSKSLAKAAEDARGGLRKVVRAVTGADKADKKKDAEGDAKGDEGAKKDGAKDDKKKDNADSGA